MFFNVIQIDLALQFYGNSSYSYPVANVSGLSFQSVSMILNPNNVVSGDLLLSTQGIVGESEAVLWLSNGSVLMNVGPDTISVGSGTIQRNQWYQLYATR